MWMKTYFILNIKSTLNKYNYNLTSLMKEEKKKKNNKKLHKKKKILCIFIVYTKIKDAIIRLLTHFFFDLLWISNIYIYIIEYKYCYN